MKKEIYRLDIKIGVNGDGEAKKKLTATERFAKQTEKRTKALDKIKASPSVRLRDKLSKPLDKVQSKLSSFSKAACSKLAAIATAGAVMIGGLGVSAAVRDFSNFEQGLANVKAISGATAQEMQVLSKEAKRLGATTAWSAKDVTDAETLLSQAGFSVKETVAALPGLLDLASAGELDLATATDITAGTLRAFGIEASKSAHVADVLALTASATNSDVSGLGESLKYVAPVSKSLGISMEETSAAIGLLANANIKGSQAGTVLRASLARLANPSKEAAETIKKLGFTAFDSQGKMLPLSQVVGNLKRSMSGLTKQQQAQAISTIFGTEAMSGMMALVEQGPEKLSNLTKELEKSDGAAHKMAETRLDSLKGQMTILKSAVEGMNIELGERLAPYAKQFVGWLTAKIPDITNKIVSLVDTVSTTIPRIISLLNSLIPVIAGVTAAFVTLKIAATIGNVIGVLGPILSNISFTFAAVAGGAATLGEGMLFLMGPIGWIALGIGLLVTAFVYAYKHSEVFREKINALGQAFMNFIQPIVNFVIPILQQIGQAFIQFGQTVAPIISRVFGDIGIVLSGFCNDILMPIIQFLLGVFVVGFEFAFSYIGTVVTAAISTVTGIAQGLITIFQGVIDFLLGVFVGNWSMAWQGVQSIFNGAVQVISSVWSGLVSLLTAPVQAVIDILDSTFHEKAAGVKRVWGEIKEWLSHPITGTVSIVKSISEKFTGANQKLKDGKAHGSNNVSSGFHEVAERGFEIVVGRQTRLFKGGERVLNNRESKKFLQPKFKTEDNEISEEKSKPQFTVAQPQLAGASGGNVNIDVDVENNFDNDTDIDGVVQEAMQEFGHKLKEALKNIKK